MPRPRQQAADCGQLTVVAPFDPDSVSVSCTPPSPSEVPGDETVSVSATVTNNNDSATVDATVVWTVDSTGEQAGLAQATGVPPGGSVTVADTFVPDSVTSNEFRGTTGVSADVENVSQVGAQAALVPSGTTAGIENSTLAVGALGTAAYFGHYLLD